jgi:phospholipid transport system substrate-binding protein
MRVPHAVTRWAGVVAWAALLAVSECALGAEMTPPDVLVKNVTLQVVDIIAKDRDIQAGNTQKVIDLVEEKVLPHFNFTDMTALAAGQNWPKATPEQKKRLTHEFRTLLVRTYASALAAYRDQKFDFLPLHAGPTDTDVTVRVKVLQSGAQPVTIDYAMEKMPGGWQVYDVVVGGVSLVSNYRTEFTNEVREHGVDGLIQSLHAKNEKLKEKAAARAESK